MTTTITTTNRCQQQRNRSRSTATTILLPRMEPRRPRIPPVWWTRLIIIVIMLLLLQSITSNNDNDGQYYHYYYFNYYFPMVRITTTMAFTMVQPASLPPSSTFRTGGVSSSQNVGTMDAAVGCSRSRSPSGWYHDRIFSFSSSLTVLSLSDGNTNTNHDCNNSSTDTNLLLSPLDVKYYYDAIPVTSTAVSQQEQNHTNSTTTTTAYEQYQQLYQHSIQNPHSFWQQKAHEYIDWSTDFDAVTTGSFFPNGDITWFTNGKLNVCYNAIDRHVLRQNSDDDTSGSEASKLALVWEGDEPNTTHQYTYEQLLAKVCRIANTLQQVGGVQKGDIVTIYMPMIPELLMTMLACARIGAVHSVVFAGFSAQALSTRLVAAQSKVLVTATYNQRGGKTLSLKHIVDTALASSPTTTSGSPDEQSHVVQKVMVWERIADDQDIPASPTFDVVPNRDMRMEVSLRQQRPYCPCAIMDSEDPLFLLYTSGSTGLPKGLVHTTGGYAVYAAFTTQTTFALNDPKDVFACVADCGWITGHTYVVYGPLINGATTVLFESTPLYPDPGRYWDMIERHAITHFYTAPTAIRSLMRYGTSYVEKYDLSSLKVLGTVGEPINPSAWEWYYNVVGKQKCTIVDTYWQTETGGHIITNIPGVTPMKPGSCTRPMYGIDAVVLDPLSGQVLSDCSDDGNHDDNVDDSTNHAAKHNQVIEGILAVRQPWPGIARTCYNDHERYLTTYMKPYPGYYLTGDAVQYDPVTKYFTIVGRIDDVINVSGHRIGTAEVESALVSHPLVTQAAVISIPHPIKGESIIGFVTLTEDGSLDTNSDTLFVELKNSVRTSIGPFASPDNLYVTNVLPMTRSGKIVRRILRKILLNEIDTIGDTSTLADPTIVDTLVQQIQSLK
jgi:acetyl-CoA synthetase